MEMISTKDMDPRAMAIDLIEAFSGVKYQTLLFPQKRKTLFFAKKSAKTTLKLFKKYDIFDPGFIRSVSGEIDGFSIFTKSSLPTKPIVF